MSLTGSRNTVIGNGARPPTTNASDTVSVGSSSSHVYLAGATDAQGVSCTNSALYLTGTSLNIGGSTGTAGQVVTSTGTGIQWGSAQTSVAVNADLSPAAPLAPLYVCNSAGYAPVTLTLPAPSTAAGAIVQVKNLAPNAPFKATSTAQVVPSGGTTASDPDPLGTGGNCTLACDGTSWYTMDLAAGTPINNSPGVPGSVAITVTPGVTPTTSSMTVTWTAPTPGASALDYYTVRIYQGGLAPGNLVTSGTVAAPTLTRTLTSTFNLTSVAVFYATVTATNLAPVGLTGHAGQSPGYSWAVVPATPGSISIAVPASASPATLSVSWTAPPVAVLPLTSYNISIYQSSTLIGQSLGVSPGAVSFSVPPVSSYSLATVPQPITAQVTAINGYGSSPVGQSVGYEWYNPSITPDGVVANDVDLNSQQCPSITVNWTAPQVYTGSETVSVRLQSTVSPGQQPALDLTSPPLDINTTSFGFGGSFHVGPYATIFWTATVTTSTGASAAVSNIDLSTN